MQNRWIGLQRQLRQLDAKIRLIMSQYHTSPMSPTVLTTPLSPYEPIPSEYFGLSKLAQEDDKRTNGSHRSSISSGYSAASADFLRSPANRPPANRPPANRQHAATLSPDMRPQSLRRRPSMASVKSSATARTDDRPPWNISTKPEYEAQKTPTNARLTSYGSRLPREGSASPTPSNPSISGSIKSRPSAAGSRIPVTSPKSKLAHTAQKQMDVPAFAVSTSHGQSFLSEDPHAGNHLVHTRQAMRTPQASRSRPSATYSAMQPRASLTPSIGQRSFSSGATRRTAPNPRKNLSYAPPSSFRPTMSTPGWTSLRPSSRMSVASYSNFDAANLQPFQPSKYDLLDQHVHSAIEEVGFDLFAGRVDLPLRKGQRKRDDEEWKGEFVFGAGEKPVGVKLLELAGRSTSGGSEGPRMKCLARTGGAWGDLAGLLMKRKAEAPRAMLDSP